MDSAAVGLAGFFTIEVKDSRSGEVRHNISFPNLITNQGMDSFGGYIPNFTTICFLGSSATEPSVMDTGMGALIATKQDRTVLRVKGSSSTAPYYGFNRFTFIFDTGTVVGTVREVGVGTATSLFSRALVTNNGVLTPLNVTAYDTVTVIYEFRIYPRIADMSTTIDLAGNLHTFTFRPALVTGGGWNNGLVTHRLGGNSEDMATHVLLYDGLINPDITGTVTGEIVPANPVVAWSPYVAGSFSKTFTVTYGLDQGNDVPTGIGSMSLFIPNGRGCFQIGASPSIQKNTSNTLTLAFRYSWARYA